jgi:hypothetical protein
VRELTNVTIYQLRPAAADKLTIEEIVRIATAASGKPIAVMTLVSVKNALMMAHLMVGV